MKCLFYSQKRASKRHICYRPAFDLAVITVRREPSYIHTLIDCIRGQAPIRLIVGEPNAPYLDGYKLFPGTEIILAQEEPWKFFQTRTLHQRACWNYWRGLTLGPARAKSCGLVLFEDDITLSSGWLQRPKCTISQVEASTSHAFILALYTAYHLNAAQDYLYTEYPKTTFFGTQAMYYSDLARAEFAAYLHSCGVRQYRLPYDLLLQEFVQRHTVDLYATVPCLAQHIGRISTGLGDFHSAVNFKDALE